MDRPGRFVPKRRGIPARDKKGGEVIAVCNFAPVLRPDYKFGVPRAGQYAE